MRRHQSYVGIVTICTLALIWTTVLTLAAERSAIRASLANFSSTDNKYRNGLAAVEFTALLQAGVSDGEQITWVERAEVEKVEKELRLTSLGAVDKRVALKQGTVLGADLVFTGTFFTNYQGRWEFSMEAIEVRRADVLWSRAFPCMAPGDRPLRQVLTEFSDHLPRIQGFVNASVQRYLQWRARPTIGVLGFDQLGIQPNAGDPPGFQDYFMKALPVAANSSGVRFINFSKPVLAGDENALVLTGIAQGNADLWSQAADSYLWATIERRMGSKSIWQHTITIHLLNGADHATLTRSNVFQTNLAAIASDLAGEAIRAAAQPAGTIATTEQRRRAALELKQAARKQMAYLPTERAALEKLERVLLLDPADREASEGYLLTKYQRNFEVTGLDHQLVRLRNYRFLRDAYDGFQRHIERFGVETVGPVESGDRAYSRFLGPLALIRSLELLDFVHERGIAYDTPPEVREQLVAELQPEILALARKVVPLPETKPFLSSLSQSLPRNAYSDSDKLFAAVFRAALGEAPAPAPAPPASRRAHEIGENQVRLYTGEVVDVIPPEKLFPKVTVANVMEEMQDTPDPGGFWRLSVFEKYRTLTLDKLTVLAERGEAEAAYVLGWSCVVLYAESLVEEHTLKPGGTPQTTQASATIRNLGIRGLVRGVFTTIGKASFEEGKRWMRRAAETGMIEAQASLGMFYTTGNFGEAEEWLTRAADRHHPGACYELGQLHWVGRLDDKSISAFPDKTPTGKWWLKAADLGHRDGPAALVTFLEDGFGPNLRGCSANLLKHVQSELSRTNTGAYYALAVIHDEGLGIPRDPIKALTWYRTTNTKAQL